MSCQQAGDSGRTEQERDGGTYSPEVSAQQMQDSSGLWTKPTEIPNLAEEFL